MRNIWATYIILAILGSFLTYEMVGWESTAAFLVGGAMLALTFGAQSWVWTLGGPRHAKKLIAFAVPLIVMKYVLFGAIIYWVTRIQGWNPVYFCLGVGSFIIALVLQPLWNKGSTTDPQNEASKANLRA